VFVHLPATYKPAALAHEPTRLARADEQVGERAPARGLDVHHALDARTRLARQEAEDRLTGRRNGRRCGLSSTRTRRPVGRLCGCRAILGSSSRRRCRRRRSRSGLGICGAGDVEERTARGGWGISMAKTGTPWS
jgi:hypothetical protein